MASEIIVIDTNAIQNLFAGGGSTAWGQLLTGGKKVVVSSVVLDELERAPGDLHRVFTNWMAASGIRKVEFKLSDIRWADGSLIRAESCYVRADSTTFALGEPIFATERGSTRYFGDGRVAANDSRLREYLRSTAR